MGEYTEYEGTLDASGMRVAIVASRFNDHVTKPLLEGALDTLRDLGLDDVPVHWVPGAFEIPLVAQRLAPACDAVICLGAVIRGDTAHFDLVAGRVRGGNPASRARHRHAGDLRCAHHRQPRAGDGPRGG